MKFHVFSAKQSASRRAGPRWWLFLPLLLGFGLLWVWMRSLDELDELEYEPEFDLDQEPSHPGSRAASQISWPEDEATRSEGELFMDRGEELLPPTPVESVSWAGVYTPPSETAGTEEAARPEAARPEAAGTGEATGSGLDPAAANQAGTLAGQAGQASRQAAPDDLEILEGIGPKIAQILKAEGIQTFRDLAETEPERLRSILRDQGLQMVNPDTWPKQARLAAEGDKAKLKNYLDQLRAGREV